ncbi:hypothetical protein BHM03_00060943 [Ensete ventricosum]|nr:hypothetical protein BHM03_00060943 [Ensete ventricosum]
MIDFAEMVNMNLFSDQQKVGGGCRSSATLASALPTTTPSPLAVQEIPLEEATRKTSEVSSEGSKSRASKGKKPAAPAKEALAPRAKPKSVKELCSARPGEDGREYHVIRVSNQSERDPDAPMVKEVQKLKAEVSLDIVAAVEQRASKANPSLIISKLSLRRRLIGGSRWNRNYTRLGNSSLTHRVD